MVLTRACLSTARCSFEPSPLSMEKVGATHSSSVGQPDEYEFKGACKIDGEVRVNEACLLPV
jgi:hypothetical protein